jgi:hypothetical protein
MYLMRLRSVPLKQTAAAERLQDSGARLLRAEGLKPAAKLTILELPIAGTVCPYNPVAGSARQRIK